MTRSPLLRSTEAGKTSECYVMVTEDVDSLRDDLIRAVKQEASVHPLPLTWSSEVAS